MGFANGEESEEHFTYRKISSWGYMPSSPSHHCKERVPRVPDFSPRLLSLWWWVHPRLSPQLQETLSITSVFIATSPWLLLAH
jgi:hypothetical protein